VDLALNLNGAGQAFVNALSLANVSMYYIWTGFSLTPTMSAGYPTHVLTPYQSGNSWGAVTFRMRLPSRSSLFGPVRMTISLPSFLSITNSSDTNTGWMLSNQWRRYLQYAVAPGYLPSSATATCTAGTNCLTANGLPGASFPTTNDKRVLLVFAGRALPADATSIPVFSAQTHHTALLADYYEGANSIADTVFTHQQGATRSFNDKIVVVAP